MTLSHYSKKGLWLANIIMAKNNIQTKLVKNFEIKIFKA